MDPEVKSLSLNPQQSAQIVAFLQALTDPRVACHMAPFDHPGLTVANGQLRKDTDNNGNADDVPLHHPRSRSWRLRPLQRAVPPPELR